MQMYEDNLQEKNTFINDHTSIDLFLRRTPITEAVELISAFLCLKRIESACESKASKPSVAFSYFVDARS